MKYTQDSYEIVMRWSTKEMKCVSYAWLSHFINSLGSVDVGVQASACSLS